jgi:hypothetical protein
VYPEYWDAPILFMVMTNTIVNAVDAADLNRRDGWISPNRQFLDLPQGSPGRAALFFKS